MTETFIRGRGPSLFLDVETLGNRTCIPVFLVDSTGTLLNLQTDANGNLLIASGDGTSITITPASGAVFETKETASQNREMVNVLRSILSELKILTMHNELVTENHFDEGNL